MGYQENNDDSFLSEDKSAMMQPIVHTNEYLAHDRWNVGADVEVPLLVARQFCHSSSCHGSTTITSRQLIRMPWLYRQAFASKRNDITLK